MRIFVTGGAGFTGSHLVDRLMVSNNRVTVFDNLSSGRMKFIQQHMGKDNFRLIEADLLDLDKVKEAVVGHEVVIHLAANPEAEVGHRKYRARFKARNYCHL